MIYPTTPVARLRRASRVAEITSGCLIVAMAIAVSGGWPLAGCASLVVAVVGYALSIWLHLRARQIAFGASMMDAPLVGPVEERYRR